MTLKFCANLSFMFHEASSLLERYELARQAGFKGVECAYPYDYSYDELIKAKSNMQQILINAIPGNGPEEKGLAANPSKTLEFKESIQKTLKYAENLNCKRIHIMAGIMNVETPQNMETYKNNLKLAAKMLEEQDIIGLIEPINKYSISNYFLDNYHKATSVIEEINSPNIRLQLDLFHLQQICGNITKNIETLLPMIGHIQVAQVPNRNEPNTQGEINYKYVFSLLEQLNYDGWIGLEYFPKSSTVAGLNWIKEYGYSL